MYTETNLPQTEEYLFTEQDVLAYGEASTGQRLLNLLIDGILIQYALAFISGIVMGMILMILAPGFAADFLGRQEAIGFLLTSYALMFFNFMVYHTICERCCNGYTLGKRITGTKAVRTDGTSLTWKDAFLRSLSRMVPFEPFSALSGAPWHDRWTGTTVVKSR
jgi:uncharacterized RDD family membrane protein YckC